MLLTKASPLPVFAISSLGIVFADFRVWVCKGKEKVSV